MLPITLRDLRVNIILGTLELSEILDVAPNFLAFITNRSQNPSPLHRADKPHILLGIWLTYQNWHRRTLRRRQVIGKDSWSSHCNRQKSFAKILDRICRTRHENDSSGNKKAILPVTFIDFFFVRISNWETCAILSSCGFWL